MKSFSHLWQYLAQYFLELEMFQIKVVEKIWTHVLCSVNNMYFYRQAQLIYFTVRSAICFGPF